MGALKVFRFFDFYERSFNHSRRSSFQQVLRVGVIFILCLFVCSGLCDKGAEEDLPTSDFHLAAYRGDEQKIRTFLFEKKVTTNFSILNDNFFQESVDLVWYDQDPQKVKQRSSSCLSCKFSVSVHNGTTPLHIAVKGQRLNIVKVKRLLISFWNIN